MKHFCIIEKISAPFRKINNKTWGEFVKRRFEETGKKITLEQAECLSNLVDNHSYYVQQLAQQRNY